MSSFKSLKPKIKKIIFSVSAYDAATKKAQLPLDTPYEIPIYNYVSSVQNPLTWGTFTDLNIEYGFDYPFSSAIW